MFRKLKQLFCNHKYIFQCSTEPYYLTCGDKNDNRKSIRYYGYCCKCGKEIEIIKSWKIDEIEKQVKGENKQ